MDIPIIAEPGFEPVRVHPGDAGADLRARERVLVPPRSRESVGTGVRIGIPFGYVGLVHPRSGLALRNGVTVLNAPGTIDHGYTGEVKVVLANTSDEPFEVRVGDRIAQLVIEEVELANFVQASSLGDSSRGEGGFGSTGA